MKPLTLRPSLRTFFFFFRSSRNPKTGSPHFRPLSSSDSEQNPKPPTLSVCCKARSRDPQNLAESGHTPSTTSFASLLPFLRSAGDYVFSGTRKFRFRQRAGGDDDTGGGGYVCSGGIGTVFLSTTMSNGQVSPFLRTLAGNPTFVSGLLAWALAQTMKVFLNFFIERRWDFGMLFNSGGMPSSHSALCTALTASVAICHGVGDSLFPVCLGFSLIVMYDAIGVRRHAGMQAEVLNKIIEDLFQGHPISQRKLKELLGHTPSQVIAGAFLGILVACICCKSPFIAIYW